MELDEVDKEIIFHLLRNGRISQSELAKLLKITQASLSYRMKRLEEEKIIKGYKLLVNPNFYGMYFAYIAFKNNVDVTYPWIFVKFNCLEELNVYGVEAKDRSQLDERITSLTKNLGEPEMLYLPEQKPYDIRPTELKLLVALNKNPRASPGELAMSAGVGARYAATKLNSLLEKRVIATIPEVELTKLNASIIAIFGKSNLEYLTSKCRLFLISTEAGYVDICFAERLDKAAEYVKRIRNVDPLAKVMIVTNFYVRGLPEEYLNLT